MIPRSDSNLRVYRQNFKDRLNKQREQREGYRLQTLDEVKAVLPAAAVRFSSVQRLYLFGSIICQGQFHAKSDVDIGVVGITAEDYFALWRELEAALPEWLIDLRDISEPSFFADRVQKTGLLIYERED